MERSHESKVSQSAIDVPVRLALAAGKRATFTFLSGGDGNKWHRLTCLNTLRDEHQGSLEQPKTLNLPKPVKIVGPYDVPVVLYVSGQWTPEPHTGSPTYRFSWTQAVKVADSPEQWVIIGDDEKENGAYRDMAVALVIA